MNFNYEGIERVSEQEYEWAERVRDVVQRPQCLDLSLWRDFTTGAVSENESLQRFRGKKVMEWQQLKKLKLLGFGKINQVNLEITHCYDKGSAGERDSKPGANIFKE